MSVCVCCLGCLQVARCPHRFSRTARLWHQALVQGVQWHRLIHIALLHRHLRWLSRPVVHASLDPTRSVIGHHIPSVVCIRAMMLVWRLRWSELFYAVFCTTLVNNDVHTGFRFCLLYSCLDSRFCVVLVILKLTKPPGMQPSHRECKLAYLVPVPSQDTLGGLCQERHPA